MNSTIKNIIMFVGIFIVIALGYWFFANRSSAPSTDQGLSGSVASTTGSGVVSPETESIAPGSGTGNDFLSALLNLNNIKLEDSVLSNPVLRALSDFSIALVSEGEAGRTNPFAPIGSDGGVSPAPAPQTPAPAPAPAPSPSPSGAGASN